VKRHFRELGQDIQTTPFTVTGIGDMSGDVFRHGMLLSRHIKLIAAFDHRHNLSSIRCPTRRPPGRAQAPVRPAALVVDDYEQVAVVGGRRHLWPRAKSITLSPEAREVWASRRPRDADRP